MKATYEKPKLEWLVFAREDLLTDSGDGLPDTEDNNGPGSAIELPKIDF